MLPPPPRYKPSETPSEPSGYAGGCAGFHANGFEPSAPLASSDAALAGAAAAQSAADSALTDDDIQSFLEPTQFALSLQYGTNLDEKPPPTPISRQAESRSAEPAEPEAATSRNASDAAAEPKDAACSRTEYPKSGV